jgi:hypothetical protein
MRNWKSTRNVCLPCLPQVCRRFPTCTPRPSPGTNSGRCRACRRAPGHWAFSGLQARFDPCSCWRWQAVSARRLRPRPGPMWRYWAPLFESAVRMPRRTSQSFSSMQVNRTNAPSSLLTRALPRAWSRFLTQSPRGLILFDVTPFDVGRKIRDRIQGEGGSLVTLRAAFSVLPPLVLA